MFALVLPLTAVLYISAEGLDPKGTDQIVTTTAEAFKVLPIAAKHPTQLYISSTLTELALGALLISYGAIAMLIRKRGSTAAIMAVLLGGIGAFCGAIVNVFVGLNLVAAATAHVPRRAAPLLLVANFNSGPGQAFTDVSPSAKLWRRSSWESLSGVAAGYHGGSPFYLRWVLS
jgi:hypothetical protein